MHTINAGDGPNLSRVYIHFSVIVTREHPRRLDINCFFDIVHTGTSYANIDAPVYISHPTRSWVRIDFRYTIQAAGWNDARVYEPIYVEMEGRMLSMNNVVFVNTTNIVDEADLEPDE